jgi:hypothetical protein
MVKRTAFLVMVALVPLSISPAEERSGSRGTAGSQLKVDARVQAPDIIGVRIHHDLCPHCKQLKPVFEKLNARVMDAPVLLVTLDLSTPPTQQQAALLVGALGLEKVWTGDLSRIGTVTFIDAKSKATLVEYRADGKESLDTALANAIQLQRR